jgi:hypothetical protein
VAIRKVLFLIYLNIYPVANISKIFEITKIFIPESANFVNFETKIDYFESRTAKMKRKEAPDGDGCLLKVVGMVG